MAGADCPHTAGRQGTEQAADSSSRGGSKATEEEVCGASGHRIERPTGMASSAHPQDSVPPFCDVSLCCTGSPMGRGGRVQAVETEEVVAGVMMDSVMDASKMVRGGRQRVDGIRR